MAIVMVIGMTTMWVMVTGMRLAGNKDDMDKGNKGNGNCNEGGGQQKGQMQQGNGDGDKGGGQADGNNNKEGNGDGNEGGVQGRGEWQGQQKQ